MRTQLLHRDKTRTKQLLFGNPEEQLLGCFIFSSMECIKARSSVVELSQKDKRECSFDKKIDSLSKDFSIIGQLKTPLKKAFATLWQRAERPCADETIDRVYFRIIKSKEFHFLILKGVVFAYAIIRGLNGKTSETQFADQAVSCLLIRLAPELSITWEAFDLLHPKLTTFLVREIIRAAASLGGDWHLFVRRFCAFYVACLHRESIVTGNLNPECFKRYGDHQVEFNIIREELELQFSTLELNYATSDALAVSELLGKAQNNWQLAFCSIYLFLSLAGEFAKTMLHGLLIVEYDDRSMSKLATMLRSPLDASICLSRMLTKDWMHCKKYKQLSVDLKIRKAKCFLSFLPVLVLLIGTQLIPHDFFLVIAFMAFLCYLRGHFLGAFSVEYLNTIIGSTDDQIVETLDDFCNAVLFYTAIECRLKKKPSARTVIRKAGHEDNAEKNYVVSSSDDTIRKACLRKVKNLFFLHALRPHIVLKNSHGVPISECRWALCHLGEQDGKLDQLWYLRKISAGILIFFHDAMFYTGDLANSDQDTCLPDVSYQDVQFFSRVIRHANGGSKKHNRSGLFQTNPSADGPWSVRGNHGATIDGVLVEKTPEPILTIIDFRTLDKAQFTRGSDHDSRSSLYCA